METLESLWLLKISMPKRVLTQLMHRKQTLQIILVKIPMQFQYKKLELITGTDATGLELKSILISGLVMIQMLEMGCIQNKVEKLVITTKDMRLSINP